MKNAREIFNRAQNAAKRVADHPSSLALRQKAKEYGRNLPESIKATTEQVNTVGQKQLKKTLNDVASGVRSLAEGLGEKPEQFCREFFAETAQANAVSKLHFTSSLVFIVVSYNIVLPLSTVPLL